MSAGAIYFGSAALVAIIGVALFVWALFADRAKGRKRCPKCWYDMSGSPTLTCSECGHACSSERELFKARRRPRTAILSGAMAVIFAFVAVGNFWLEDYKAFLPKGALIYLINHSDQPWPAEALGERLNAYATRTGDAADWPKGLSDRQWKQIATGQIARIERDAGSIDIDRVALLSWAVRTLNSESMRTRLVDIAPILFHDRDSGVRWHAAVFAIDPADFEASRKAMYERYRSDDPRLREAAYIASYALLRYDVVELEPLVAGMMIETDPDARGIAAALVLRLVQSGHPPPDLMQLLLEFDGEPVTSAASYWRTRHLASLLPHDQRLVFMRNALRDEESRDAIVLAIFIDHAISPPVLADLLREFDEHSEPGLSLVNSARRVTGLPDDADLAQITERLEDLSEFPARDRSPLH